MAYRLQALRLVRAMRTEDSETTAAILAGTADPLELAFELSTFAVVLADSMYGPDFVTEVTRMIANISEEMTR